MQCSVSLHAYAHACILLQCGLRQHLCARHSHQPEPMIVWHYRILESAGDFQGNFYLCYCEILKLLKLSLREIALQLVYEEDLDTDPPTDKACSTSAMRSKDSNGRHCLNLDVGLLLHVVKNGTSSLQLATCRFWLSKAVQVSVKC